MKPQKYKRLPEFKNGDEEREFWSTHDTGRKVPGILRCPF